MLDKIFVFFVFMLILSGCQHVIYFGGSMSNVCVSVIDTNNSSTLTPTTTLSPTIPAFAAVKNDIPKESTATPNGKIKCESSLQTK